MLHIVYNADNITYIGIQISLWSTFRVHCKRFIQLFAFIRKDAVIRDHECMTFIEA